MFLHLSDADLGRIIAWLRTQSPRAVEPPPSRNGPIVRLSMLPFKLRDDGLLAADEEVDHIYSCLKTLAG